MIYLGIILLLLVLGAVAWFVSARLSPIPYFPTLNNDLKLIDKALNLKSGDTLLDLGAGDGKMIFRYAQPKIKAIGVEVNPYLVAIMHWRRLFQPHKKQIIIRGEDLFKTDLREATHIYLFVGPFLMERIMKYILANKGEHLKRIVSYRYDPKVHSGHGIKKNTVFNGHQKTYLLRF